MNNLAKREMELWRRPMGAKSPSASGAKTTMARPSIAKLVAEPQYTMPPWLMSSARWPTASDFPVTTPSWWSPAWANYSPTTAMLSDALVTPAEVAEATNVANPAAWFWSDAAAFPMSSMMNFEWPSQLTQTTVNEKGDLVMKTKLPSGIEQDDIHLDFEMGGLRLSATKSHEELKKAPAGTPGHTKHTSYISVGHYWPLDEGVTEKDVEANFHRDEGVLEIVVNLPHKLETPQKTKTTPISIGGISTPHRTILAGNTHAHRHPHLAEELARDHHAKTARDISNMKPEAAAAAATTTTTTTTTNNNMGAAPAAGSGSGTMEAATTPATGEMAKTTTNVIDSMNAASTSIKEKVQSTASTLTTKAGETTQKAGEAMQKMGAKMGASASHPNSSSSQSSSTKPKVAVGPDAPQIPSLDEM